MDEIVPERHNGSNWDRYQDAAGRYKRPQNYVFDIFSCSKLLSDTWKTVVIQQREYKVGK